MIHRYTCYIYLHAIFVFTYVYIYIYAHVSCNNISTIVDYYVNTNKRMYVAITYLCYHGIFHRCPQIHLQICLWMFRIDIPANYSLYMSNMVDMVFGRDSKIHVIYPRSQDEVVI